MELIRAAGIPVSAPSANRSGRPSPTTGGHCREDLDGLVDMIIDGGEVGIGLESTIVDLTGSVPEILRPGYITREMLSDVLGRVDNDETLYSDDSGQAPRAPGMKYRHYAPKGSLTIVEGAPEDVVRRICLEVEAARAEGARTGVICTDETAGRYTADVVLSAGVRGDMESAGHMLFSILRRFDDEGCDRIWSESFEGEGFGRAVMNRLIKAAGHSVIRA